MDRGDEIFDDRPHRHKPMSYETEFRYDSSHCGICGKPIIQYGSWLCGPFPVWILLLFCLSYILMHPNKNGTDLFFAALAFLLNLVLRYLGRRFGNYICEDERPKGWRIKNRLAAIACCSNCIWLITAAVWQAVLIAELYERISFAAVLSVAVYPLCVIPICLLFTYIVVRLSFPSNAKPQFATSDVVQFNVIAALMFALGGLPLPLLCMPIAVLLAQIPAYVIMKKREEAK